MQSDLESSEVKSNPTQNDFISSVVPSSATIGNCLNAINSSPYKICVLTEGEVVVGVVTDGDVRRALLKGSSLSDSNQIFLGRDFLKTYSTEIMSIKKLIEYMRSEKIQYCPQLDQNDRLIGIISTYETVSRSKNNYPVIILAGGKGKRLRPLTLNCPKPMIRLGNEPILEILLKRLRNYGFQSFSISVNYLKDQIIDYFGSGTDFSVSIKYLIEDKCLGTAGPLSLYSASSKDPILVTNGDVLTDLDYLALVNHHIKGDYDVTVCIRAEKTKLSFGLVHTDGQRLINIEEKPTLKHNVSAGIYVMSPAVLKHIDAGSYLDMPDLINKLIEHNYHVGTYLIHDYWIDIGHPETLLAARQDMDASPKPENHSSSD